MTHATEMPVLLLKLGATGAREASSSTVAGYPTRQRSQFFHRAGCPRCLASDGHLRDHAPTPVFSHGCFAALHLADTSSMADQPPATPSMSALACYGHSRFIALVRRNWQTEQSHFQAARFRRARDSLCSRRRLLRRKSSSPVHSELLRVVTALADPGWPERRVRMRQRLHVQCLMHSLP